MRYMLLIYESEASFQTISEEEGNKIMGEYMAFTDDIRRGGQYVAGAPLQPTPTATTVRVSNGKTLTTDGPFAETREQLGGYYLVDAKDLNEAIALAARIPAARTGSIEVRPIMEIPAQV
jgi:hypothetical protein